MIALRKNFIAVADALVANLQCRGDWGANTSYALDRIQSHVVNFEA